MSRQERGNTNSKRGIIDWNLNGHTQLEKGRSKNLEQLKSEEKNSKGREKIKTVNWMWVIEGLKKIFNAV